MRILHCVLLLLVGPLAQAAGKAPVYYDATYLAEVRPRDGAIDMEVKLSGERLPSRVVLQIDPKRHQNFSSTDPLDVAGARVTWEPKGRESRLRYRFIVNHERAPGRYDSRMTPDWTIFRAEKLVPRASVKARRSLHSRATLELKLPTGWAIATPYAATKDDDFQFDDADRRFDQPKGWFIAGKIGTRNEKVGATRVTIAAPVGDDARRQDTLAFLNWTLPRLQEVFTGFPGRLLIVSAGDPMWRGGLSAPGSLFLHSDRPLISENRTSTLLHELVHVAMGIRGDEESDWIVEGLAEYYSLEVLHRSGSISASRHKQAIQKLSEWARRAPTLFEDQSSGATTARAVLTFRDVDAEIRKATGAKASLDDLARKLAKEKDDISLDRLQKLAAEIAGRPLTSLERARLTKPAVARAE
jgi:predicted metalloprotease with PDZ domain